MRLSTLLSLAALAAPCSATDLIVGPGNFPTLQAAIAAAVPGDRILLDQDEFATDTLSPSPVPGGLTIESMPGGPRRSIRLSDLFQISVEWPINGAVTLRNLEIIVEDPGDVPTTWGVRINAPGERVVFDRVDVSVATSMTCGTLPCLVSINAQEVLIKDSSFVAVDAVELASFTTAPVTIATDALIVSADQLVMEDVDLRGGSAPITRDTDTPGPGGAALLATTESTMIVRCEFSDGSGGWQNLGTPFDPMAPRGITSAAGASTFGTIDYLGETSWELALPGSDTAAPSSRGQEIDIGDPVAPLSSSGGQLGGMITLSIASTPDPTFQARFLTIGLGFFPVGIPGPFGRLLVNSISTQLAVPGMSLNFAVPNDPSLVGIVFASQLVVDAPLRFENPSFVELHL